MIIVHGRVSVSLSRHNYRKQLANLVARPFAFELRKI